MGESSLKDIISVSLILFSVINILGNVPVIVELRKKFGHVRSSEATLVSGFIMVVFLLVGERILQLFGIDVTSFAIASAIVMFLLGMEMILNLQLFKSDPEKSNSASMVPIAFPLMAGAGTMTALISLKAEDDTINILMGVFFNLFFIFIILKTSGWLEKVIGKAGFNILRKVFGIVLLAVSIKKFKNHWML